MKTNITRHIPNVFTLFNLLSGGLSIVFSFQGELTWAGIMIMIGAGFDFLDGTMARLLHAFSTLGKELDSLSDLVSFGVAPAMLVYALINGGFLGPDFPFWFPFIGFLIMACAALRLARFNIDPEQSVPFKGMPVPAGALFIAAYPFLLRQPDLFYLPAFNSLLMIGVWSVFIAVMFLIPMPLFSLKFKKLNLKDNFSRYLFLLISLILLLVYQIPAIPLMIILYIFISVFIRLRYHAINK